MPLFTADALVLRTYKLGEADRIVVFLTRDRGKKRGVAKGARRTRSRFVGALEPLTRARVAYFEKEQRELVGLTYVDPVCSPLVLSSATALGHVGYFAELIDEWAPEADPNERLFRLGAAVVDALTRGVDVEPLARYFEFWLLRLQGVYPSLRVCHGCGGGLEGGARLGWGGKVFVCTRCGPADARIRLSPAAIAFLHAAGRTGPEQVGSLALSRQGTLELAAAHQALLATHLEKELKSIRVLREIGGPRMEGVR